jgi:hypothetical protein
VQDQNWFAVGLDFFIVVVGILLAFQITNWSEARQKATELKRAEASIQSDLRSNYYFAQERLSLADCRVNRIREVSERLLEPSDNWQGMPLPTVETQNALNLTIDSVLRSKSRPWGSRVWKAELSLGTFSLMDTDRRELLDMLFYQAERMQRLQDEILTLQARLNVLSQTTTILQPDRLRYVDILTEIDHKSALLELMAQQLSSRITTVGIDRVDRQTRSEMVSFMTEDYERQKAEYGDCMKPIDLFFLKPQEEGVALLVDDVLSSP